MAIVFAPIAQIRIVRGTKWEDDIRLVDEATGEPISLAGITELWMRVRDEVDGQILLELTRTNGRLVVTDPATGVIGIRVDSITTLTLPENDHERGDYVFDIVIERTPDEYEAGVSGRLAVLPQVTRPWGTT